MGSRWRCLVTEPATTVWCASFPKSGNTWIRALFAGVTGDGSVRLNNLAGHSAGNDERAIFREFGLTPSVLDDQHANELMDALGSSVATRSGVPVFRKTHNLFNANDPKAPRHVLRTPTRALCIVRDPRAVAVSMAHHMGYSQTRAVEVMAHGPLALRDSAPRAGNGPPDRYVTRGCQVAFDWGSWSNNVTSWLDQDRVPVKLVRYEDLIADTLAQIRDLAAWLHLDVPPQRLQQAVTESSFERLASQEESAGFIEATAPDRRFFRRGSTDGWRDELEPGLAEQLLADHSVVFRRLGYSE